MPHEQKGHSTLMLEEALYGYVSKAFAQGIYSIIALPFHHIICLKCIFSCPIYIEWTLLPQVFGPVYFFGGFVTEMVKL